MKHNIKITVIILAMFLITQFIGLYVVNHYSGEKNQIPYGMDSPPIESESDYYSFFSGIVLAFVLAILLLFFLMKFDFSLVLRAWFFIVVLIALGISFNAILPQFKYASLIAMLIALPLAYLKLFKSNFIIHNGTEIFVYPGIAAIFVPLLNIYTVAFLLIAISTYDIWAVWHSGVMMKMAKYQIKNLKVISGFFMPYLSKTQKQKIKNMKKSELNKKKIKVNVAILGGGDIIFPIITAGVFMIKYGLPFALFIIGGALLGLSYLLFTSEKKKSYPAMPFLTAGMLIGAILGYLILF